MRALWTVVQLLAVAAGAHAQDPWSGFRHDAGHTGASPDSVRPPLELKWRVVDVPDLDRANFWPWEMEPLLTPHGPRPRKDHMGYIGWPWPLVADAGCVVITRDWHVVALDARTGDELWTMPKRGHPVGLDRGVYVRDGSILLSPRERREAGVRGPKVAAIIGHAVDTGEVLWRLDSRDLHGLRDVYPVFSSPQCAAFGLLVHDGFVYAAAARRVDFEREAVIAWVDIETGAIDGADPCIPAGVVLREGELSPYERFTMQAITDQALLLRLERSFAADLVDPTQAIEAGENARALLRGGAGPQPPPWAACKTGEVTVAPRDATVDIHGIAPPTVASDFSQVALRFEPVGGGEFGLVGRDLMTGERLWRQPLNASVSEYHGPALGGATAYMGMGDGCVYGLDVETGDETWHTHVGEPVPRSFAHSGKWAYPGSRTGVPGYTNGFAPICSLAKDTLWVVYLGKLLALNATTGELLWETEEAHVAWHEAVIYDGWIYLKTCRGVEAWGPVEDG